MLQTSAWDIYTEMYCTPYLNVESINPLILTDHFSSYSNWVVCAFVISGKKKSHKKSATDLGRNFAWTKMTGCSPNDTLFSAYLLHFIKLLYFDSTYGNGLYLDFELLQLETKLPWRCQVVMHLLRLCFVTYLNDFEGASAIWSPDSNREEEK